MPVPERRSETGERKIGSSPVGLLSFRSGLELFADDVQLPFELGLELIEALAELGAEILVQAAEFAHFQRQQPTVAAEPMIAEVLQTVWVLHLAKLRLKLLLQ